PIKGFEGAASGVVPVMKLFEDSFSYSNQLGQRQGAGAVYLNVFHPDIIAFLSTKKENADEKVRVKTLSLGLVVPDKFYELARKNEEMYLFSPYSVEKVYGVPFSYIDITKEYDNLVKNPLIRKTKIVARELEEEISKLQQESGYPYIVN
ncbi:ribonucleotide-diphosphate reductase subunit alpha, partial [Erwiniaceae bacterium Til 1]|nr:ribonucleotide-diphosphate reductase subunit alpha [Winslowiella arboricola]